MHNSRHAPGNGTPSVNFIFMLTRDDRTVPDCETVLETAIDTGLRHIGFKDIGVDTRTLALLADRLRSAGVTSYLEVVSESPEASLRSARMACEIGIDRLLGGTEVEATLDLLAGTGIRYYPFPGRPSGHPTRLGGTAEQVAAHCRSFTALGCAGVDLLAYRATEADPLALVAAARDALPSGELVVAGSIENDGQIATLAAAGVDAFTIGSAIFDGSFHPAAADIGARLRAVLDSCATA